ncbi:MAG TPA: hypothetical protein VF761_17145 [Gemmatimonadaceae bacterium]
MQFTDEQIRAAAAAIANARAGRRGAPPVSNVLDILKGLQGAATGGSLYDEVMDDARVALEAAAQALTDQRQAAANAFPLPHIIKVARIPTAELLRDRGGRGRVFDAFVTMVGESVSGDHPLLRLPADNPEGGAPLELTLILHPPFPKADAEEDRSQ